MHPGELRLLERSLCKARRYVEWGGGNSTIYAASKFRLEKMVTIETDKALVDKLKLDQRIRPLLRKGKLELIHANVGPTLEWGWPANRGPALAAGLMWQNLCEKLPQDIDTVLIDGRYRVPATLLSLLLWPEATFLFHDFTNREHYQGLCEFMDIEAVCDSLIVFKRKKAPAASSLTREFVKSMFNAA